MLVSSCACPLKAKPVLLDQLSSVERSSFCGLSPRTVLRKPSLLLRSRTKVAESRPSSILYSVEDGEKLAPAEKWAAAISIRLEEALPRRISGLSGAIATLARAENSVAARSVLMVTPSGRIWPRIGAVSKPPLRLTLAKSLIGKVTPADALSTGKRAKPVGWPRLSAAGGIGNTTRSTDSRKVAGPDWSMA